MADTYGALTGKPGVCLATLGPGAINLMLGIANAQLDSHPLVAITAQAGLGPHLQGVPPVRRLVSLYRPITKWGDMVTPPAARAGDDRARRSSRPRPNGRAPRSSIAARRTSPELPGAASRCPVNVPRDPAPVRGPGAPGGARPARRPSTPWCWRVRAWRATAPSTRSIRFSERLNLPVATTFLGKGVFPDDHPNALGTIGFMVRDYANFGF